MYSKRLKQIRKDKKLTQKNVADTLGISEISYTNYENEYYIIPINYLIIFSKCYDISIDYIFGLSMNNKVTFDTNMLKAGQRLKEWRSKNKLTQDKIALVLNTNRSVIANYERGRNYIATPFLYTLCKKYNISADYLLGKTDESNCINKKDANQ